MIQVFLYLLFLLELSWNCVIFSSLSSWLGRVIVNFHYSEVSGFLCILALILKNYQSELWYISRKFLNLCLSKSRSPDFWKVSPIVEIFRNIWEISATRNYRPGSLLFLVNKLLEKFVNNMLVDYLEKFNFFSHFQYNFRSSHSTAHLLTVISDRIIKVLNRPGATQTVELDMTKSFDRVGHNDLFC